MAEPTSSLYVAHEADLDTLKGHWQAAREGQPRAVHLVAPIGGGKRALVGELCRAAAAEDDDAIIWRPTLTDEEDGVQALLRIYAGLFAALHRSPTLRGKIEMTLNSQLPKQPARVQRWYQAFIEGLKKGAPKPGEDKFQVIMPRDNPLVGLVEVTLGIARKFPIILDLQNIHNTHSLGLAALVEALVREAHHGQEPAHLLLLLGSVPLDEEARAWVSLPLQDALKRTEQHLQTLHMQPWGAEQVEKYLASKGLSGDAGRLSEIVGGRPGYIAELVDWLSENGRLDDMGDLTLASIADVTPDPDELEGDDDEDEDEGEAGGEEGAGEKRAGRKVAGVEDAEKVAYLAALLGLSFPSNLVADMGAFTRDSVDDLLDATDKIYKELQFSQPLGTWIYQFHRALLRDSILARHQGEEDKNIAQRVGVFMEQRLVPRGYPYLVKTMRLYAESGAPGRAGALRSVALSSDQPQMWAMVHDLLGYFDEIDWPQPMRRTIYMNLLDRMVNAGDVNQAETLYNQAIAWANGIEDRPMQAWLLLAGSRLNLRRQDLYRARDRANDALKMYRGLDDKFKQAEVLIHLGMVELSDGNPNAARDKAGEAIELANVPPIQSNAHFIRGLVAKNERRFEEAVEQFRRANELAGQAGQGPLALEAGLNLGETLLISNQHSRAADVLTRVVQIAGALNNPARERAATSLLAQARASLKQFEGAIEAANRTLELTRSLQFTRLEAIDTYNLGLFHLMRGSATEAVSLFRQAREKADVTNVGFMKELLFNMGNALVQIGERSSGAEALNASIPHSTQSKDWRKVAGAHQLLAQLAAQAGDRDSAQKRLNAALQAAEKGNLKEERKGIRRALDTLKES